MLATELNHGRAALDAEPRLERVRFVIETGVNDSTVVARLMRSNLLLFLRTTT